MADIEIPAGQPLPDPPGIDAWLRDRLTGRAGPALSSRAPAEAPAMTTRRVSFASPDLTLPEARAAARRAYDRAKGSGALAPVVVDRRGRIRSCARTARRPRRPPSCTDGPSIDDFGRRSRALAAVRWGAHKNAENRLGSSRPHRRPPCSHDVAEPAALWHRGRGNLFW